MQKSFSVHQFQEYSGERRQEVEKSTIEKRKRERERERQSHRNFRNCRLPPAPEKKKGDHFASFFCSFVLCPLTFRPSQTSASCRPRSVAALNDNVASDTFPARFLAPTDRPTAVGHDGVDVVVDVVKGKEAMHAVSQFLFAKRSCFLRSNSALSTGRK
jgi:hypothetical protein